MSKTPPILRSRTRVHITSRNKDRWEKKIHMSWQLQVVKTLNFSWHTAIVCVIFMRHDCVFLQQIAFLRRKATFPWLVHLCNFVIGVQLSDSAISQVCICCLRKNRNSNSPHYIDEKNLCCLHRNIRSMQKASWPTQIYLTFSLSFLSYSPSLLGW